MTFTAPCTLTAAYKSFTQNKQSQSCRIFPLTNWRVIRLEDLLAGWCHRWGRCHQRRGVMMILQQLILQPARGASGLNSVTSCSTSSALSGALSPLSLRDPPRPLPHHPCPLTTVPVWTAHIIVSFGRVKRWKPYVAFVLCKRTGGAGGHVDIQPIYHRQRCNEFNRCL